MKPSKRPAWILSSATVLLCAASADGQSIGVNFRRGTGEQNMAATESAGVVPQMNWNNTDGDGLRQWRREHHRPHRQFDCR